MKYPPQLLDEIRARINVSDVVGRTVALKKRGREYSGLSPFKSEKTASFFVNDHKGFYHCFASGEHGDIFSFLMKTEGLAFPEAVQRLAEETGVELPKQRDYNPERQDERNRLVDLLECAATFFEANLRSSAARDARGYVQRRGLQAETLATFRIGYAPASRTALGSHLKQAGFTASEIIASGMQIAGEDIATPYDRFRDRIMFPIADARGRVVAFGGRALDPKQPAKYLNSPETPVFHKGHLLYNAHRARPAAHDSGDLIVVEGYMDVIALAQAGLMHAVAPLGTALTSDQIKLLWRMCPEPTLCFDGDSAGKRAANRAIDTVLPELKAGVSLHFAFLPSGADPDDLIREQGVAAFRQVVQRRRPLAEALWDREWGDGDWSMPERRAKLESDLRKLVLSIADPAVRTHYGHIIAGKLREAWRPAYSKKPYGNQGAGQSWKRQAGSNGRQRGLATGVNSRFGGGGLADATAHSASLKTTPFVAPGDAARKNREALLLRTLVNHAWLIEDVAEEFADLSFDNRAFADLRDALLAAVADEKTLDTSGLRNHLNGSGFSPHLEQIERLATNKCHAFAEPDADRITVENGWRDILSLHQQQYLRDQLAEAERDYTTNMEESALEEALARILELQRQIATIVPKEAALE